MTLTGGDFTGTITAAPSGGQLYSNLHVAFTGNGTLSKTFSFTPLDPDTITWTLTNSGSLSNPSPKPYISIGEYLLDSTNGTVGTLIQNWLSQTLSDGIAGSSYTVPSSGAIALDGQTPSAFYNAIAGGTGMTSLSYSTAPMPPKLSCEYIFSFTNYGNIAGDAWAGIMLMNGGGNTLAWGYTHTVNAFCLIYNGTYYLSAGSTSAPAPGVTWLIRVDVLPGLPGYPANGAGIQVIVYNSTNLLTPSWSLIFDYNFYYQVTVPTNIAAGIFFGGSTAATTSTGLHIGNFLVQDPLPPSPTCQIALTSPAGTAGAYVTTGGQSIAFFFETISGNTAIFPTAMNFAPSFYQNGISIGVGTNAWVTGYHSCAILQLQPGTQINPGDVVTVSAPASWMSCGSTNSANLINNYQIANYTGTSCFGTDTLVKTFKPGLNFSALGTSDGTEYNVPLNWRFRLEPAEAGSQNTVDGYPTAMYHTTETLSFLSLALPTASIRPIIPAYRACGRSGSMIITWPMEARQPRWPSYRKILLRPRSRRFLLSTIRAAAD